MQFANDFSLKFCCGNILHSLCGRLRDVKNRGESKRSLLRVGAVAI